MNFDHAAPLGIALLGLILGMRHATDADHVVAVSTIVTRERRLGIAAMIGMFWGFGHTLTIIMVGVAIIVFRITIPPRVGLGMEFAVALVLILLGISAVTTLLGKAAARFMGREAPAPQPAKLIVHAHEHPHGPTHHHHPHVHVMTGAGELAVGGAGHLAEDHPDHRLPREAAMMPGVAGLMVRLGTRFPLGKAFGVGLVHGLAGSAAIALLVLSAIPKPLWEVIYLAVFGAGTVLGMILITTAMGMPLTMARGRAENFNRALAFGSGLLSFGFGLFLAYHIGMVDGLFLSVPVWKPH